MTLRINNFLFIFISVTILCATSSFAFVANYTLGSEFHINTFTTDNQFSPSIASNGQDYLVTWASNGQDGNSYGVYGQRINSSGNIRAVNRFRGKFYRIRIFNQYLYHGLSE